MIGTGDRMISPEDRPRNEESPPGGRAFFRPILSKWGLLVSDHCMSMAGGGAPELSLRRRNHCASVRDSWRITSPQSSATCAIVAEGTMPAFR